MTRLRARLAAALALCSLALLATACASPRRASAGQPRCLDCHAVHNADAGTCVTCHRGDPAATRAVLAHRTLLRGPAVAHAWPQGESVRLGNATIERAACRRCHVIGGRGSSVGASLDRVVHGREQAALRDSIRAPVDNMPDFGLDEVATDRVIAALLAQAPRVVADPSYRVWFTDEAEREPGAFERHCGGCHRLLTSDGPLGVSNAGPHLAGLFTEFHPKTAPGDVAWTPTLLRRWLDNPRALRPATPMPRPVLTADEVDEILRALGSGPAPPASVPDSR